MGEHFVCWFESSQSSHGMVGNCFYLSRVLPFRIVFSPRKTRCITQSQNGKIRWNNCQTSLECCDMPWRVDASLHIWDRYWSVPAPIKCSPSQFFGKPVVFNFWHDVQLKEYLLVPIDVVSLFLVECFNQNRTGVDFFLNYIPHVVCYVDESVDFNLGRFGFRECRPWVFSSVLELVIFQEPWVFVWVLYFP